MLVRVVEGGENEFAERERERESSNSNIVSTNSVVSCNNRRVSSSAVSCFNSRAQGTTEYLIIIAVVVVISLVVVGLLVNQTGSVESVSVNSSKLGLWSNVISVTETAVSSDGNYFVQLSNNTGGFVTVSSVKVGDVNVFFSEDLSVGGSRGFVVPSGGVCEVGKVVTSDLVVTYVTPEGLTKIERFPAKVAFSCGNYYATQANLANQCPSYGGSQSLSADSYHMNAGVYSASDLNVIDSDLNAKNISSKVSIFGITGYLGLHSGANLCSNAANNGFVSCSTGGIKVNQDAALDSDRNMFDTNRFSAETLGGGNSVVHDYWFKLMWQNTHIGGRNWNAAMDYCNSLTTGGFSNWRLPTISEAFTQFDFGASYNGGSFACVKQFTDCYGDWTWTSTSLPWDASHAYLFRPANGYVSYAPKAHVYSVRCVRSEN